jgi:hypothetical protein
MMAKVRGNKWKQNGNGGMMMVKVTTKQTMKWA